MALGWADLSDLSWFLDKRVEALALEGARRSLFRLVSGAWEKWSADGLWKVVLTLGSREDNGSQWGGQAVTHWVGLCVPLNKGCSQAERKVTVIWHLYSGHGWKLTSTRALVSGWLCLMFPQQLSGLQWGHMLAGTCRHRRGARATCAELGVS